MKILLHGCQVGFSYYLKEIIKQARQRGIPAEWSMILYSNADTLLEECESLLGAEHCLYLQGRLNHYMASQKVDLNELKTFPASLFECVFTSKVFPGHKDLQRKSRNYQLKLISGTYKIYKEFLLKERPDFIFFPIIESYDSMILYNLCKELSIKPIVYDHGRSLGVAFFTDSMYQGLPGYVHRLELSNQARERAEDFITAFRDNPAGPSLPLGSLPSPEDVVYIPYLKRGLFTRIYQFAAKRIKDIIRRMAGKDTILEPHLTDGYTLPHLLKIQFISWTILWRKIKGNRERRFADIRRVDELPKKFIYYPLQYGPETSLNTPSPFFIDQMRAIDLILNFMPSDHYLVVKEHPSMEGMRPACFYKELKKRSNVLLADTLINNYEIVKRSALTISVTGTACLEAFLFGKPSLHIGRAFFSEWIYRFDSFAGLRGLINDAIRSEKVEMDRIVDMAGRIFMIGGNLPIFSPMDPYLQYEFLMNRPNFNRFLDMLMLHIERTNKDQV